MRVRTGLVAAFAVLVAVLIPAQAAVAQAVRGPTIRLDSPRAYQVIQRDAVGHASISVRGRCTGFDGRLRVRWGDGPWVGVRAARDGAFSARLDVTGPGQAPLQVVSLSRPSLTATRGFVGVGDIFVIAGQSNASGRSPVMTEVGYEGLQPALFGNDDRWKALRDPVDSPLGQVDKVSADRRAAGSVWPLVAAELLGEETVPVAFVPCARGSVPLSRWLPKPGARTSRRNLYGSMLRRVKAVGGVRAVLFWEGEGDARAGTPRDEFARELRSFARAIRADIGAPVVAAQIGDFNPELHRPPNVDAVRAGMSDACVGSPDLVRGPSLYDIDLGGGCHFGAAEAKATAAHRWGAAILGGVLGRDVPAAPRLTGATYDGAVTVELRFSGAPLATGPSGGFTVEASGAQVAVASAEVTGPATVTLTLAAPSAGPLTVSLGEGRAGAGAPVPVESSPWRLPAQTALRLRVTDALAGASATLP
jgi:hypothetical protein